MPPSVLIVTPALVALVVFMRRYYIKDPRRRGTDPNFLAALASIGAAMGYVWLHGFDAAGPATAYAFMAAGWGMLAAAVIVTFRIPIISDEQPSP